MRYTIRYLIDQMSKIHTHALCFRGHKEAVNLMYGKPDDIYCEYSYSRWKHIKQFGINRKKPVCRQIHCAIPKVLITKEIERYCIDSKDELYDERFTFADFIIPERVFNEWMSNYEVDITRTISDPYYMMVDCLEMSNW